MNDKPRYAVRYGIGPVYEVYDIETNATVERYRWGNRRRAREHYRGIALSRANLTRDSLNRNQRKGEA